MICVFGLTMAVFACIWNAASIDLGWLFLYVSFLIYYTYKLLTYLGLWVYSSAAPSSQQPSQ
jgi:uncharacterized membrane protein YoaT (DUF817 family)